MQSATQSIESILAAAVDIASEAERGQFVDQACAGDAELQRRVQQLIENHFQAGNFLESPAATLPSLAGESAAGGAGAAGEGRAGVAAAGAGLTVDEPSTTERPGTLVGPYKLLEQIGEGGFGIVFMAEQQHPLRRKVAVKVLKPGMDSRQVIARFEAERQALALMDHPNIARVLDAGQTNGGRPYFVMDLVKGLPITDYCDQNQLAPKERLQLFVHVCQALQHAHQKGIIHRDLKPSNVLVTMQDGLPLVKVIDFGIAKALGQQLTDKTLFTGFTQMVGTPLYMSPEQAAFSNVDVDTRSDIYSLGVLLYELLTGTTPFDRERLKQADYDEVRRIIREEEPHKPSTRISTLGQAGTTLAARRRSDPRRLSQLCRGELDWIVMKALEKDRSRRYETVTAFAADVQHYLQDEPVQACPPSAGYRLLKLARRHRAAVLAASLVFFALVGGMIGTTWGLVRAEQSGRDALAAAVAEREAKETAQERAGDTEAVLKFVEDKLLAAAQPGRLGPNVTLRQAVEAAVPFVEGSFKSRPLIEARLRLTLGVSFSHLGEARRAAEQFRAADKLYARQHGPDDPGALTCMNNLAASYEALGHYDDALRLYEETLTVMKDKHGTDYAYTLRSTNRLANCYDALGRHDEALKLYDQTLAIQKDRLGPDHPDTLVTMNSLANCYRALGRHDDAVKLHKETLALMKARLGADHPDTLTCMNNLAVSYKAVGRNADAVKLQEETLALMKARLGADHPDTLTCVNNLAVSYYALGRPADALKLYEEALPLMKVKFGPDHPHTLQAMHSLVKTYDALDRPSDALKLREETLTLRRARLGPDHADTLASTNSLAWFLATASDARLRDAGRAVELATTTTNHSPNDGDFWNTLGAARYRAGQWQAAITALEKSMALRKGGDSSDWFFLSMAHWQLGAQDQARQWYDKAVRWMDRNQPSNKDLRRFQAEAAALINPKP
jgi:serine/threonine protein kinase/tetratricopeptide (TPR) repeat protein